MTRSFVTGATGLIGRHLVDRLLARGGAVSILLRPGSRASRRAALERWGERVEVWPGDVTEPGLGLSDAHAAALADIDHVFHVAGYYDLEGAPAQMEAVNVEGTRRLLALLEGRGFAGVLHHVSSVAVAGTHDGAFGEDMLDEGQRFAHPYHRSKHASETLVRSSTLRWRVYRPSAVVGHSKTGQMDRIDGPYFLFRAIHALRNALPPWVTLPGFEGPALNMVPVDFVADAIAAIASQPGLDARGFHLVDPAPPSFRQTFNLIAEAAGAPKLGKARLGKLTRMLPGANHVIAQLESLRFMRRELAADFGVPASVRAAANPDVTYETTNVEAALASTGIRCPPQSAYVEALWDYYLRNLDPKRDRKKRYAAAFDGKRALVTGASSGIGRAMALTLAEAGAHVVLVARRRAELEQLRDEIETAGGEATVAPADLTDHAAVDAMMARALPVDLLINNAGKSIRRPLAESLERFHDLERVMQINFFAPARLIRSALPSMRERGGHIVNVLSAGAHFPSPRFGAYTASKAALSQLGDVLAAEHLHENVRVTNAYLHWVRTPMMDATGKYEDTRAMTPEEATAMVLDGVLDRKQHVARGTDVRRFALARIHPSGLARILNVLYRIYADDPATHPELELDRQVLKRFVRGRLL